MAYLGGLPFFLFFYFFLFFFIFFCLLGRSPLFSLVCALNFKTCITPHSHSYRLHAKAVLHTVGPMGIKPEVLRRAYRSALDQSLAHGLKSIALCAISTGIFGYDIRKATPVAMAEVRKWLEEDDHASQMEAIIFCVFTDADKRAYEAYMPTFFPVELNE